MNTDKDMLDWLEVQNAKKLCSGRCAFRWSTTGRGWRLHEMPERDSVILRDNEKTFGTVREAIDFAMFQDKGMNQ